MNKILIDGNSLTLEQLRSVAYDNAPIELTDESKAKVVKCRDFLESIVKEERVVYGLTTGFGKFANVTIPVEQIEELQTNLIISHATGVGNYFSIPETRAIMLLRINVLAKGHSGIRLSTLENLIEMLNKGVHPCIPEKGSVGASGDLAPLSHLALVLLGMGKAEYKGRIIEGSQAMKEAGLVPVRLAAKEGLALNNGTQVMTAVGALTLLRAEELARVADVCAAASLDAILGTKEAYNILVHKLRPHNGQLMSAGNLYKILENSPLQKSHEECANVQDPYSFRCSPQVHGAVRDALAYVRSAIETEMNSATDNPLIFPDEEKVISGGNFHGEPIAFACDTLGFTVSELGNIGERRMEQLLNPALNRGLKPFLAPRPGLDSGFMIAQLTSASLITENKVLAHPSSVDSIPTSANQEDHVSMGTTGAVKARTIIDNTAYVLGIELLAACQALDERNEKSSAVIEEVKAAVREGVKKLEKDRNINDDILFMKDFVLSGRITEIANKYMELK